MKLRYIITALVAGLGMGVFTHAAYANSPVVYVDNVSSVVSQADLAAALPAFQTAVSRDLAPVWGTDATLTSDPAQEAAAQMVVKLEDESDACGMAGCALGYHDVIGGKPVARVFAKTSSDFHEAWPLTFSHELFEMLVDPWINRQAQWHGRQWLVEVCDPPESGMYAYFVDGVPVSDFITPRWYDAKLRGPFDFTHGLRRSGQIGRHGYASFWAGSSWSQVYG